MPTTQKYWIDGRVCVPGKRNPFLNLANPKQLNDIIYQVIYGTAPGTQAGPLLIQNGLDETVTTANYIIELGGPLIRDTSISGALTYDYSVTGILNMLYTGTNLDITFSNEIEITGNTLLLEAVLAADLIAPAIAIAADTQLSIRTPNVIASTATNGQVLTLIDDATGEAEYQDIKYTQSFIDTDWTGANLAIPASTHGKGLNPVVSVINSDLSYQVLPGNSLGIAGLWLDEIKISAIGDVTLVHGTNGTYNGRVIII